MHDRPDLVCLAAVAAAHGVRGELRLRCFTERPENVAAYGPLLDERGDRRFRVRVLRAAKGGAIVAAEGVHDRDAAEALRGLRLHVPRAALPPAGEDEFYHEDLVGLAVAAPDGRTLGEVVAVHDFGAGDVIAWRDTDGAERLTPFTRAHVPTVDLAAERLVVADEALAEAS